MSEARQWNENRRKESRRGTEDMLGGGSRLKTVVMAAGRMGAGVSPITIAPDELGDSFAAHCVQNRSTICDLLWCAWDPMDGPVYVGVVSD